MELSKLLSEGICGGCKCEVVFAHSVSLGASGREAHKKKCLNCGQVYQQVDEWEKEKGG